MPEAQQLSLLGSRETRQQAADYIKDVLASARQPSAPELVAELDLAIGIVARWDLEAVLASLIDDRGMTRSEHDYLRWLLEEEDLLVALRGESAPDQEVISTIDTLLQASRSYRNSNDFREMIGFMGRFKDYAPYNNMLVRIQNPTCSFYATANDWRNRFGRTLIEDARPMLILAPMHPVMLVYDLDQTEGAELPAELENFSNFQGGWEPDWLHRLVKNAYRHRIRVDFKRLSSTQSGFATLAKDSGGKMRIVINGKLPELSRFGVLCHEMAHILLGHLGCDEDRWWPARSHLGRSAIEVEAEATAYVVTRHLGLEGASAAYVSRHLQADAAVPAGVSFDMIAKVAGRIERMATQLESAPLTKAERKARR